MAIENERVTADAVDIQEFPDLARRYAVIGVPKIIMNDQLELIGSQPESTLLAAVLQIGDGGAPETS